MNFPSYWKEIAVFLAGTFAILSAIFEVRDKKTGRITAWGRSFFALTIFSMIGGIYAQWAENKSDAVRQDAAQRQMLTVMEKTQRSVFELSRLILPIDKAKLTIFLQPDCEKYSLEFCHSVVAEARREADVLHLRGNTSFTVRHVDWEKMAVTASICVYSCGVS